MSITLQLCSPSFGGGRLDYGCQSIFLFSCTVHQVVDRASLVPKQVKTLEQKIYLLFNVNGDSDLCSVHVGTKLDVQTTSSYGNSLSFHIILHSC